METKKILTPEQTAKAIAVAKHLKTMENQIKPDWITDKQWSTVPSVEWWEDSKKQAQSIAQSKPVTPEEALSQTTRLRNSKNWNQGV
jgi:hypothetical protein